MRDDWRKAFKQFLTIIKISQRQFAQNELGMSPTGLARYLQQDGNEFGMNKLRQLYNSGLSIDWLFDENAPSMFSYSEKGRNLQRLYGETVKYLNYVKADGFSELNTNERTWNIIFNNCMKYNRFNEKIIPGTDLFEMFNNYFAKAGALTIEMLAYLVEIGFDIDLLKDVNPLAYSYMNTLRNYFYTDGPNENDKNDLKQSNKKKTEYVELYEVVRSLKNELNDIKKDLKKSR